MAVVPQMAVGELALQAAPGGTWRPHFVAGPDKIRSTGNRNAPIVAFLRALRRLGEESFRPRPRMLSCPPHPPGQSSWLWIAPVGSIRRTLAPLTPSSWRQRLNAAPIRGPCRLRRPDQAGCRIFGHQDDWPRRDVLTGTQSRRHRAGRDGVFHRGVTARSRYIWLSTRPMAICLLLAAGMAPGPRSARQSEGGRGRTCSRTYRAGGTAHRSGGGSLAEPCGHPSCVACTRCRGSAIPVSANQSRSASVTWAPRRRRSQVSGTQTVYSMFPAQHRRVMP